MRWTRARLRPWTGTRRSGPTGDPVACVTTCMTSAPSDWFVIAPFCPTLGILQLTPRVREECSRHMARVTTVTSGSPWRNWAGNQTAVAAQVARPDSVAELAAAVRDA